MKGDKIFYERTFSTRWAEGRGNGYRFTATVEIHSLGGQAPYFAVTGELTKNGHVMACGMMHDEARKHFPKLRPFFKWHLVSGTKGPMHYIANALYHAGLTGKYTANPPNLDHWKSTVIFGAVPTDPEDANEVFTLDKEAMTEWLNGRFDALMDAFHQDMAKLFDGYNPADLATD